MVDGSLSLRVVSLVGCGWQTLTDKGQMSVGPLRDKVRDKVTAEELFKVQYSSDYPALKCLSRVVG